MVPATLFDRISSYDALLAGWERVRANRGASGGDGQTIASFERNLERNLRALSAALVQGAYRPGPLRRVEIPKPHGGTRTLAIPTVTDRVVQTAVAQALFPILDPEMEDSSFAYRPGRSAAMAADRVAGHYREGYRWVVDADIDDYFDTIPHPALLDTIGKYVADVKVLELIALWLRSYFPEGQGLAQGSPLSPILSNIYLDGVDEAISGHGVRLVRFADDFVLLCKSEAGAAKAEDRVAELLARQGLRLNLDKTRIVSFDQGFSFLGRLFVRSLVLKEPQEETAEEPEEEALEPPETRAVIVSLPAPAPLPPPEVAAEEEEPEEKTRLAPRVRILYVVGQGRRVDVRNQAFSVLASDEPGAPELLAIAPLRVDRIELWPGTTISAKAQRHALALGKQVAYVNGWGETLGTLEPPPPDKARLHLAQAACVLDEARRLDLARRIVEGRLRNQRALLRRLNRRRKDPAAEEILQALNRIIKTGPAAATVEALMGHEGEAAKLYWRGLRSQIDPVWRFSRRQRRPPGDPVNVVISYTATMLYRDILCLVQRHGLHPGFGALHGSLDGHQGCASDLIEEFRAPLSEGLAVYLVNNSLLKPGMFTAIPDNACLADPEGRRSIIHAFEDWLDRAVKSPRSGCKIKWRGIVEEQVVAYREHILGNEAYRPYLMDY